MEKLRPSELLGYPEPTSGDLGPHPSSVVAEMARELEPQFIYL